MARFRETCERAGDKRHVAAGSCSLSEPEAQVLDAVVERKQRGAGILSVEQLDESGASHLEHIRATGTLGHEVDRAALIEAQRPAKRQRLAERLPIDHQGQIERELHSSAGTDVPAKFDAPAQLVDE